MPRTSYCADSNVPTELAGAVLWRYDLLPCLGLGLCLFPPKGEKSPMSSNLSKVSIHPVSGLGLGKGRAQLQARARARARAANTCCHCCCELLWAPGQCTRTLCRRGLCAGGRGSAASSPTRRSCCPTSHPQCLCSACFHCYLLWALHPARQVFSSRGLSPPLYLM